MNVLIHIGGIHDMERRYRFFRGFGYLLLTVGCLVIVLAFAAALIWWTMPTITVSAGEVIEGPPNRAQAINTLIAGMAGGLSLIFLSQLISILYGIEANTRASAHSLNRLIDNRQRRERTN